ncbi:MAG: TauD/TfdA family dioxygenase, partial [Acidimicrobiaceae bacterium]|nr:TauD/TfdA family dioxygenase [Acidimicrobiaceae bacterium]
MDATLGAELGNVRLNDLDDETWKRVEEAFNTYGVLVAHDQYLTLDEQLAFGARFGELCRNDVSRTPRPGGDTPIPGPFIPVVGNIDRDGKHHTDPEDPYIRGGIGNNEWHSDSSFQRLGAIDSILAGIEVPTGGGGQTEFADMRAAYDALPAETTERLAGLRAWHSVTYSRVALGAMDMDLPEDLTTLP